MEQLAIVTAQQTRRRISNLVRKVFGLSALREGQQAVIDAVLAASPAMLMPGMTVVISPLIALMRDQCDRLSALGLRAVQVNSAIGAAPRNGRS